MNNVHFSSKNQAWSTPQDFFDKLDKEFNFTLDPCCSVETAKCSKFYTESDDGLSKDWSSEVVFMNPPYGREIAKWMEKAYLEYLKGATVVCLIPSRTDTKYWHEHIFPHYYKGDVEVRFLKGRLTFGTEDYWTDIWESKFLNDKPNTLYKKYGKKNTAPFPSAVIVYGGF